MFGITLKRSLATVAVAVAVGTLAAAGSASAATQPSGVVTYNGHAGLGASVYQHDQTDLEFIADGTSNTIMFGLRTAAPVLMADMGGQLL